MARKSINESTEINKIKNVASEAKSLKEVAEKTGINYKRVLYILSKHPIIKERILKELDGNSTADTVGKNKKTKKEEKPCKNDRYIVVDASICGANGALAAIHREIEQNNSRIILTDITVEELSKLEDGEDNASYVARRILHNSNMHPETYEYIKIDRNAETADMNIVNFTKTLKNGVLFTADKSMSIMAKLEGIEVNFFIISCKELYGIKYEDNIPYLEAGKNSKGFVIIRSQGITYYKEKHRLKNDDEVFIFKEDADGIKMLYFKIIISNSVKSVLADRIFIKNNYVLYKYKPLYEVYTKHNI